jgi:sugar-specific transcriptional regulator TrmB
MDLESAFEFFGMTPLEGRLYVALLQQGALNGSELARLQNLTRASVYTTLQKLTDKGVVRIIPGQPQRFEAIPHRALTKNFAKKAQENLSFISETLDELPEPSGRYHVLNFTDIRQFESDVIEKIESAEKEIYLSACRDLGFLDHALRTAVRRKVRVILFTFSAQEQSSAKESIVCGLKVFKGLETFVRHSLPESHVTSARMMCVTDMAYAHSGGFMGDGSFLGIGSAHSLFVKIISEHIHHDIYLSKIEEKIGRNPVDSSILIRSLHEKNP